MAASSSSEKGKLFQPREILVDVKLCCDGSWDYCQSRTGRKRIRLLLAPFFLVASVMLLVIGAIWARLLAPECGQEAKSAKFLMTNSTTNRLFGGNGCPGYDWNTLKRPKTRETAGEYKFSFLLPLSPIISVQPFYVGRSNSIDGPIGVALNGVAIYGPSARDGEDTNEIEGNQGDNDQCGGSSSPPNRGPFSAPITGYYHYRSMPGIRYPKDSSFSYCTESKAWYNETESGHSPIVGFMADGIPVYGPYTKNRNIPLDLDECGGHSSDQNFYHYHFQAKYPYSVNCLRGCVDGSLNNVVRSPCLANGTVKYDYSSLKTLTVSYGGDGVNHTNW
jgi:hypothetical protein